MKIYNHPMFGSKYCPICGTRKDEPAIAIVSENYLTHLIHVNCIDLSLVTCKCENDSNISVISMMYKEKPLFPGE